MNTLPIPGFIDLQVNGYLGIDFSSPDLTEGSFIQACDSLFKSGTAVFLPTVITSPLDVLERNLSLIASIIAREPFRNRLPGIHLEGPFISGEFGAVGAHNPEWVRKPDVALFQRMVSWAKGSIRILTLAPELDGADQLARYARSQGIIVSLGHTLATPIDLDRLSQAGAVALTHLGNGLPHMLHKFNNPLWNGLADDRYTAMMIGDGHHIPDGVLKAMIRSKGIARTIIVSDASPISGLPPGNYSTLGNDVVLEESGRLWNPKKGFLVGSSSTMFGCMNHIAALKIFSLDDLLNLGFYNPLRMIEYLPSHVPTDPLIEYDTSTQVFHLLHGGL